LLINLPQAFIDGLNRQDIARVDIVLLIQQLERVGRLTETGVMPLYILAENASMGMEGTESGKKLRNIMKAIQDFYGGEPVTPVLALPPAPPEKKSLSVPEAVILMDERVSYRFMALALRTAASVARLRVPRIVDGQPDGQFCYGTGWVIAPGLLITNYHVINARSYMSAPASPTDFAAQGASTQVWFNYRIENDGERVEQTASEVMCSSPPDKLDYAILRLGTSPSGLRNALSLVRQQPILAKGDRLNIVQHPKGGPLQFAIRGNYYVGAGKAPYHLRYLTDTEPGSSGSPILDDGWNVVGLHRSSERAIGDQVVSGQPVYVNNEGIAIHAILGDLPNPIYSTIANAQELPQRGMQ
jgi:endonuclease G, mitochondrial